MLDHVTIRVSDREASERFYEVVLRTLGVEQTHSVEQFAEWNDFSLAAANDEKPVTRRLHVAFGASSRAHGFLLDPDGNSAEAVHHGTSGGGIDHLWIRVADVAAAKRFYETIAPSAAIPTVRP